VWWARDPAEPDAGDNQDSGPDQDRYGAHPHADRAPGDVGVTKREQDPLGPCAETEADRHGSDSLCQWRGRAVGRRHRGGGVGGGGCARLPSSAAGMRSVSSTRFRCAWTLWAVSGNRCDRVVSNEKRSLHGRISSGSAAL
jgi:hypothetical protein